MRASASAEYTSTPYTSPCQALTNSCAAASFISVVTSDILSRTMSNAPTRVGKDLSAEERRLQILRAAARCLAQQGYEAVRLKDIAAEAGVTTGALQYYWESRELLLEQAFEQVSIDLLDRWQATTADVNDPWQQIVVLVEQLATAPDVRRHCSLWTEFAVVAGRNQFMRPGFRSIYDNWRQLLTDAVLAGVSSGTSGRRSPSTTS